MSRQNLSIYNSLTGKKEKFTPLQEEKVGMYVCGPTLYSDPHMGNMRTFINFDLIYRYLLALEYKVKYVRNITDAGHITNSAGDEVDSIGLAAKKEHIQPLEIVYKYNTVFQDLQRTYNMLPPTIEPTATGHIQEQIEIIEKIIENGLAYVINGSVYFDTKKYSESYDYGILSGRKIDELAEETRELSAQDDKRFFADFALWKKANPDDMQIWRSPWGNGNPGWHIECTAMSTKYLGKHFDIHGGGMDLKFPHHEDEIAQSCASLGCSPANYWMHANMLEVNGKKMSKSLGNFFLPMEIVEGTSKLFEKPFSPNVVRFAMTQAHYRSPMDISNESLLASEKGLTRLLAALKSLSNLGSSQTSSSDVGAMIDSFYKAMNDDFNTPVLVANLFDTVKFINSVKDGKATISAVDLASLKLEMKRFTLDILGIKTESSSIDERLSPVMELVLDLRQNARTNKDWTTSDQIRDGLAKAGIVVKDGKDGTEWS
jgi:cysteinyl-tRNA synthetase